MRIRVHLIVQYVSEGSAVAMASHGLPVVRFPLRLEERERWALQIHRFA
jgi:hypothetical protein